MDFVMGNGVDIGDGSQVGEETSVEVGVSQEGIVERVVVGSSELKDLDGEEVFWEAMSEPKIFPEQLEESDSRYCGSGGGSGHVEVIGETGLQVVDENPNAKIEAERFDEASCVPSVEALTIIEDKVDLVGGKIVDGAVVFEVGTEKEMETDRYSGSREVFDSGENGADGLSEVGSGGEVDIRSDLGIEKSGNRDFNNLTSEQIPVDEKSENGGDKVGGFFIKSLQETELSKEILNEDGNGEQLKDDNLRIECQDIESRELKDATAVIALNHEDDSSGISYCSGNVKQCQAGVESEYHVETCVLKDVSDDQHTLMEESSVTSVIGGSLSAEMSKTESAGNSLGNENHLRAEDTGVFQLMRADEDDHEVSNNHAEETPTKEDNAAQEERRAQVNGDQEIQPAPEPTSSSEKSTNPAPPALPARPAGLGRSAPLLEPAPRVVQQPRVNGSVSSMQSQQVEDSTNGETEEYDETREKLQMIRVKFLRLAHRLGQTPHNVVVAQVLYRLGLAEQLRGRNGGRVGAFSFDRASAMAEQLEAAGQEPLDFSCTIMVLGKTGVGKSATVNSIFDEVKFGTDAFHLGTKKVQDVVGTVQGIKVRIIDTPGLLPSLSDQTQNEKMLHSVKQFIKKTPPDIVLYLDRLDMQSRDLSDMPLLHTITEIFGPSIWFNAIVVLTHAASAPPDGPNGTASSYDMFVTQRSHVVQQAIRQAAGDMRLMNPVSLVENHSACRTNRAGQRVLPNGQVWKPHLLLLSFASKILAEANTLLKLQDSPTGKPFPNRTRAPPLPFLLSSLLQSRPQLKLPEEQFGDGDDFDDDLDESSDSDEESEFDELPPFKRLTKAQEARLSKSQKKEYFDELEYREKLFMKKQLKEEKKRRKIMKKMASSTKGLPNDLSKDEEESGSAAAVPIPLPDYALPASFDSDNPTHRYRHLDSSHQWLVRPVLDTHGWDHDVGYEGINVERLFVVKEKIPLSFSGQVTKDKKDANVQLEAVSSIKHGEGKATSLGFDMQTVGKDLAYTLRSETRFCNFRKNKATAGLSVTLLGDALSAGLKVEDKLIANKRFQLVMTGGAMRARGDVAYGGSLEAQLRDKDYPLGRSLSTLGLSVMDWHGDLAIGCNLQSQIPIGRSSNLIARVNLNNRGAGQASIRLNSSEQIQLALVGLIPLLRKLHGHLQQLSSE
ncbi:translocase of chloroplast 120, chloroplastic-like [Juglans microcarpa x Juglans regia]|uniref:translocase of chloroplast 120, chloroplastic-like n=1 Tax=Juglans microcarpa x Juglans regia TaxID=2249226 RepID=UPI001B7E146E|nr:translocase of chloroplast 120, chloroplastic-like [Juglans microcarpa x Juglans regia]XP_041013693.1 translocase of chloroplast 120, chloroplastic-like [Juglans microcarpa x Juglans regia]